MTNNKIQNVIEIYILSSKNYHEWITFFNDSQKCTLTVI